MAFKIIATLLILTVSLEMSSGSAIPIWEFLSRNEKMSYLYSTFAKLVSDHCKTNAAASRTVPVNHCKRDLLNYGYEKLQTFADHQLDTLDPYQRGANELIWATMIRGHPAVTVTTSRYPSQTQSTQSPSSVVILSHQNHPSYPANPIFDDHERKHTFAMDMDTAYGYAPPPSAPSQLSAEDRFSMHSTSPTSFKQPTYLSGPFVFRVRPDGSPIEEDKHKPYPLDDDLEAFQIAKQSKVATISTIKQKRLASLASQHLTVQQQQQQQSSAAHQLQRDRRQFKNVNSQYPSVVAGTTYYSRRLVHV
ncbi:rhythmically expressed gene 5 protein [Eupeodes corollae]|uniref:rhythmically expressed gene 5 protein n=1 Tax=Eupeodes corollae TaxID=290404 RepID=UPI00249217C8|nr:rhythmically expressed gene 5 protein [Eupeodes corollae]